MRVVVNMDACASTGMCERICPEVFEVQGDGLLHVLDEAPPDGLRDTLLEAQQRCPTGALSVEG